MVLWRRDAVGPLFLLVLLSLSLVACRGLAGYGAAPGDLASEPEGGIDAAIDGAVDAAGDALSPADVGGEPQPVTVTFKGLPQSIPIGQHAELQLTVAPVPPLLRLLASPCRLKQKGADEPLRDEVELPPSGGQVDLVIHAALDAPPDAVCTLRSPDSWVSIPDNGVKLTPAVYGPLALDSSYTSEYVIGLRVTKLATLASTYPVQGLVWAGGAFGGRWVVLTGRRDESYPGTSTSTVRIYWLPKWSGAPEAVNAWVDLQDTNASPVVADDLGWRAQGLCGQDALYVAAHPAPNTQGAGGIFCFSSTGAQKKILTNKDLTRTFDLDPLGTFRPDSAKGMVYYSRNGGHHTYPGTQLTPTDVPGLTILSRRLRFYDRGPFAGALVAIGYEAADNNYTRLVRISPAPHPTTVLSQGVKLSDLALNPAGALGALTVAAEVRTTYGQVDLTAFFGGRKLPLLKNVRCGRLAFDAEGRRALLAVMEWQNCALVTGTTTLYRLEVDVP